MKIIVNPHKLEIAKSPVNEKEINVTECEFEFAEEITDNYVKEAYFTFKGNTYKQIIVNNKCDIPSEVLDEKGQVELGVVAYIVENGEELKRYNPSPAYFNTWVGSLKEEYENTEPITPTDLEQLQSVVAGKQNMLVSGTNIKTINNESLLGSGNINIQGGSGGSSDYEDLENKPKINNVELIGNKSLTDLGIDNSVIITDDFLSLDEESTEQEIYDAFGSKSELESIVAGLLDGKPLYMLVKIPSEDIDGTDTVYYNPCYYNCSMTSQTPEYDITFSIVDGSSNENTLTVELDGEGSTSITSVAFAKQQSNQYATTNYVDNAIAGCSTDKSLTYWLETNLSTTTEWDGTVDLTNNDLTKLSAIIKKVYDNEQNFFNLILTSANGRKMPLTFTYAEKLMNIQNKPTYMNLYTIASNNRIVNNNNSYQIYSVQLSINISWNNTTPTVSQARVIVDKNSYLSTTNTGVYTPTSNYHPATKKYVDDAITSAITTTLGGSF